MAKLSLDLRLFDGEGGAPAGDGAQQAEAQQPAVSRRATKTGGNTVVYGKAPDTGSDAGSTEQPTKETQPAEDKPAKFRELISGEYKDEYTKEFQTAFNRRFREAKDNEEALSKQQPIMDMLMRKYGVDDAAKLAQAIEKDDSLWSDAAEKSGMTVDQYKEYQRLQAENESFRKMQAQAESRAKSEAQYRQWSAETDSLRADYPDFDLAAECKDPQFLASVRALTYAGFPDPVRRAYETAHINDIKNSVARTAAQSAEKNVVDGIRAKGSRAVENGVSSQSGITYKTDVSKLTRRDRAEIARRAERGEHIEF